MVSLMEIVFSAGANQTPEVLKYFVQLCRDGGAPESFVHMYEQKLREVKEYQRDNGVSDAWNPKDSNPKESK
jgi:hypothetical protein